MAIEMYSVTGLGFGDEGKGATVDFLVDRHRRQSSGAKATVVRYNGGPQCSHAVGRFVSDKATFHQFHQLGSGTLAGAATYIHKTTIIEPGALLVEAKALSDTFGRSEQTTLNKLFIHESCPITTPYAMILNTLRSRRLKKKNTCGLGIGATKEYVLNYGQDAVTFRDTLHNSNKSRLAKSVLVDKLQLQYERLVHTAYEEDILTSLDDELLVRDPRSAKSGRALTPVYLADKLMEASNDIVAHSYVVSDFGGDYISAGSMLRCENLVVFEGGQGILLDQLYGTTPYNTWSDCTLKNALDIISYLRENYEAEITSTWHLGVLRSYHTRHGDGPFPTANLPTNHSWPVDINNPTNNNQGMFRSGAFDAVLLDYALNVWRKQTQTDDKYGLVLNHLDQFPGVYCYGYGNGSKTITEFDKLVSSVVEAVGSTMASYATSFLVSRRLSAITDKNVLPPQLSDKVSVSEFVSRVSELSQLPVVITANGPMPTDRQDLTAIGG